MFNNDNKLTYASFVDKLHLINQISVNYVNFYRNKKL